MSLDPASPIEEQLQLLQQRVQAVLPQVGLLTCERPVGHDGSSVLLPVHHNGTLTCVVGFHAKQAEVFAELIGLTVRDHFQALASLDVATQLAHEFAALRDFETGSHLNRVSLLARQIAEGLAASNGLSSAHVDQIGRFSRLHDIGKIGIPDAVLLKEGPLTDAERLVMNTHVDLGVAMIEKVLGQNALDHLPGALVLRNVIQHHHERLDGSGYPQGLRGEQISLEGRIVAVADVFDALTSRCPYRHGCSVAEGLALVEEQAAAGQLDRHCVAALAAHPEALEGVLAAYGDQSVVVAELGDERVA